MPSPAKPRWNVQQLSRAIRHELQPERLIPSLTAGAIAGIFLVIYAVSFGALIFNGTLAPYVSAGIGFALFTAIAVSVIVALTSSLPGILIIPQDAPAIIMALVISSIATQFPASAPASALFATVVVAIALTSILVGITCFALGTFKLGNLTRFAPYPVVGGFLAGTGYLIAQGGFSLLADRFFSLTELGVLLQPELLIRWLPGFLFGILLLFILRRYNNAFIVPGLTLGGTALFYLALLLTRTSIAEARAYELLLPDFPTGALWQPLEPSLLLEVQWSLIAGQTVRIITVVLLCVMMLLLNSTGIELTFGKEVDLNQELRATGIANIVAGLGGGLIGFHGLGLSTLCARVGAKSRIVGLLAALVCVVALFAGGFVSLVPKAVLGGMLIFLGLSLLVEWLWDERFKLPRFDYALVLIILVVMALVGFLEGVGLGLAIAMVLFVVSYSRTNVARHIFSGSSYQSHAVRSLSESRVLRQAGDQICILDLQGYLFFGTATTLLNRIRQLHQASDRSLKFVVLNFHAVTGFDSSAALGFAKLKQIAQQQAFYLVFVQLSPDILKLLQRSAVLQPDDPVCHLFPDLDRGVEWCENQILAGLEWRRKRALPLIMQMDTWLPDKVNDLSQMMDYLEEMEVATGALLFTPETPAVQLHLVESGQVTVWARYGEPQAQRLRTVGPGALIGEMEFFLNTGYRTSAIADSASVIYCLSREAYHRMQADSPQTAIAFQKAVNYLLAERLSYAYQEINQLLR